MSCANAGAAHTSAITNTNGIRFTRPSLELERIATTACNTCYSHNDTNPIMPTNRNGGRWLILIHQLPARPSSLRVTIWRRLQHLGAIALRNSVYVLPNTAET